MKDIEYRPGKRAVAGASTRPGRQQRPLQQPPGPESPASAEGNRADGRSTLAGNYAIQIMLATWALRELSAQRRLPRRRGGPQTA